MPIFRRLLVLSFAVLGAAVLAGPVFAKNIARGAAVAPYTCQDYPFTLGSAHFVVHYESTVNSACDLPRGITETTAGDVLGYAEVAYREIVNAGYPVPPSDGALGGDSRIDFYMVVGETADGTAPAMTYPDTNAASTTASINLDTRTGINPFTIAREVFIVFQMGMWQPAAPSEFWLVYESAEWMAAKINGYNSFFTSTLGPTDMALDCKDPIGSNKCDLASAYRNLAYSRWPFWESVYQKYGVTFVREVFQHGGANPLETGVAALSGALSNHGATLADTFTSWTIQQMSGTYGISTLDVVKPQPWYVVKTGIVTTNLQTLNVPVNHLATRLIEFDRGDGSGSTACFAATLDLTISLPAGVGSRPYFYWNGLNSQPVALSVNGNTATASLPWDTCTWVGNQGYLNLPNPSTDPTHNGMVFTVVSKITVDTTKPGQAATPPEPVSVRGPVIPVTGADVAPTLFAFGPELLRLDAKTPVVRLIVRSSGEGTVRASLGSTVLGTDSVRPGNNDVRFTVPKSLLPGLRVSSAASGNVLTLIPLSSSGNVAGTPVTRKVSLDSPTTKRIVKKVVKKRVVKRHLKRRLAHAENEG